MDTATLSNVVINLPLYEHFLAAGQEVGKPFKRDFCEEGRDSLDIIFSRRSELSNFGYYCTPTNSLGFANTGIDGEHFSFLVIESAINAQSPIVVTAPMGLEGSQNAIVAESFRDFLRLWMRFGGFPLVDLAFRQKHALKIYTDAHWRPKESDITYKHDSDHKAVLASVAAKLDLSPYIYTVEEFYSLQKRYMPLLQMLPEYDE